MTSSNFRKMYLANAKAKDWLIEHKFRDIHMFPHTRFSKDLNFYDFKFDGVCVNTQQVCFFQVKTNCKPTATYQQRIREFASQYGVLCLWFNNNLALRRLEVIE